MQHYSLPGEKEEWLDNSDVLVHPKPYDSKPEPCGDLLTSTNYYDPLICVAANENAGWAIYG
ncbi:hypothetical protein BTUL_0210g00170 [Botrytis tulipae]|uniref:Uncharacterized protein n=1 Tax=Botrytis tulipae TaxID=87230 RepID=A0A4Z1E8B8_9HELO|nr:hypothetical protein BTUL_0210g00170 [Botrytis tulipae]